MSDVAAAVLVLVLSAASFATLATWVELDPRPGWDLALLRFAHGHESAWLDRLMLSLTQGAAAPGMAALAAFVFAILLLRQRRGDALFFAAAMAGAAVLNGFMKLAFARPRPGLWPVLGPASGSSFPSGHALSSMALLAALVALVCSRRAGLLLAAAGGLLVLMVGGSRVYLGAHFPSDVVAGWSLALAWVSALVLLRLRGRMPRNGNLPAGSGRSGT